MTTFINTNSPYACGLTTNPCRNITAKSPFIFFLWLFAFNIFSKEWHIDKDIYTYFMKIKIKN